MTEQLPRSWRDRFEQSARRYRPGEHSVDEIVADMPIDSISPDMDDLHRAAMRTIVARQVAFISADLEYAARLCDSPIERAMLYALAVVAWDYCDGVLFRVDAGAAGTLATRGSYLEIHPQAPVGRYRVDLLLTFVTPEAIADDDGAVTGFRRRTNSLIVECDGHDWHDRTRDQATRDRARDRALQTRGMPVFRYTGSDIWKDVFAHAGETMAELHRRAAT